MNLVLLEGALAVCRLDVGSPIPDWAASGNGFFSITRTDEELSVVCPEGCVPDDLVCERGFRGLKVVGPLDFSLTGILASLAKPLADAGISIFAISTYDTDYILVREQDLNQAIRTLTDHGHRLIKL